MSDSNEVTLTSPDGDRTWKTGDPEELTNLRARGWSEVKPKAAVKDTPKSEK